MESNFTITTISTSRSLLVTDSSGRTAFPGKADIWSLSLPKPSSWYCDGVGSKIPIVYLIPELAAEKWDIPISMVATFTFPHSWNGEYKIEGKLKDAEGNEIVVLESDTYFVPQHTHPLVPVPVPVREFQMRAPVKDGIPKLPFGWVGDFEWFITNVDNPENSAKCQTPTRLELYWTLHSATAGPLVVRTERVLTSVDFSSSYPVELLRLFWPSPLEFKNITADITDVDASAAWYIQRAIQAIWTMDPKPKFDSGLGASSYGMTCIGGYFDLKRWMTKNLVNATCNSFDLAGIVQLACAVLLNRDGQETVRSRWVLQEPYGLITPGALFGWEELESCNNPYFLMNGTQPLMDPESNPIDPEVGRTGFPRRAWIEAYFDMGRDQRVLDVTHCLGGVPEYGSRSREEYLDAHTDSLSNAPEQITTSLFGNLKNNGIANPTGSCYEEPEFRESIHDKRAIDRIGVRGVNSVGTWLRQLDDMKLPKRIERAIERTLETGLQDPSIIPECNASFEPEAVCAAFSSVAHAKPLRTSTTIGIDHTQRSIDCELSSHEASLRIDISVHTTPDAAMESLVYYLAGFETDIDLITQLPDDLSAFPSASFLLETPRSFFWINGNIFVTLHYTSTKRITIDTSNSLTEIGKRLNEYLDAGKFLEPSQLTPGIAFKPKTLIPTSVKVGTVFSYQLNSMVNVAKESFGISSAPEIVLAEGVISDNGIFRFYAKAKGEAVLYLSYAHEKTLYPETIEIVVRVVGGTDPE